MTDFNPEEKAKELMNAPLAEQPTVSDIAAALREAQHDGARRMASYAVSEALTILQQHDVSPSVVSTLCHLYQDDKANPGAVLNHEEADEDD